MTNNIHFGNTRSQLILAFQELLHHDMETNCVLGIARILITCGIVRWQSIFFIDKEPLQN